jgi:rhodanese-related sulfurtransferase
MRTVTRDELRALLDAGTATVVEALSADDYTAEHIPGAVNVPGVLSAEEAARIAPDPTSPVVVYCSGPTCRRSRVTAGAFERLGYQDVRVYPGGKADWWRAGLPLAGHRAEAEVSE